MWRASRTHDGCRASLLRLGLQLAVCHHIRGDTQDVHRRAVQCCSRFDPVAKRLRAVTPFALSVRTQRPKKVDVAEVRPVCLAKVELTVGALQEQETTEPLLARGADHQVGVGLTPGVETVSYTHLRAHETGRNLVCRLLLEK